MDLARPAAFLGSSFLVRVAREPWEIEAAAQLRHAVFCEEQQVFASSDRDDIDPVAIPLVAVSMIAGEADQVIGTVRIHQPDAGIWWGSRLAVAASHRRVGILGPALIRLAVSSANAAGCHRFLAHVQPQNELLFRRMHWNRLDQVELHGRLHSLMSADLSHYPALTDGRPGFQLLSRRAA